MARAGRASLIHGEYREEGYTHERFLKWQNSADRELETLLQTAALICTKQENLKVFLDLNIRDLAHKKTQVDKLTGLQLINRADMMQQIYASCCRWQACMHPLMV